MNDISPSVAAQLAKRIYSVQDSELVDVFLSLPYFKTKSDTTKPQHKHLKASVGGRLILRTDDGFGMCVEGGDDYQKQLFLIFRGTTQANHGADMLTDARIGLQPSTAGLPVHIGFDHCFRSMLPQIRRFLDGYKDKSVRAVHCIGHSLGGAIATLAADYVARIAKMPTKLYTFGQPRVGTDWFVKSTTDTVGSGNIHRVYHRTDPVSMVPLYPFRHAPYGNNGHFLPSTEPLTSGKAHMMDKYAQSVSGRSWGSMDNSSESVYNIEAAIENWLKSKSPVESDSAFFWKWAEAALIYVLKKIAMGAILTLQAGFIGTFTLADKVAYILAKGIDLASNISIWIVRLMRKLMQALKMRVVKDKNELSRSLMRTVLMRMRSKAEEDARQAMRSQR